MNGQELLRQVTTAFREDAGLPPPLSLRGANAIDSYASPPPFDPALDAPVDAYLEQHALWGVAYLDAPSWRHYLPRLVEYALAHPDDRCMVAEAMVRSLRPPDRYPPRLASLSAEQERAVRLVLDAITRGEAVPHLADDARQALEEWWLPEPRARPTPAQTARLRAAAVDDRRESTAHYELILPAPFTGSGPRYIAEEQRHVQVWGGYLCGDAPAVVAVNVVPRAGQRLAELVRQRAVLFRDPVTPEPVRIPGAIEAVRVDGWTRGDSPAEAQRLVMIVAAREPDIVMLTVRTWPRDDVDRARDRILDSLKLRSSHG